MPDPPVKIDWGKVQGAPQATPQIDWGSVPSSAGSDDPYHYSEMRASHPNTPTTIGPRSGGPVRQWLEDAQSDVMHGTDLTLPGKILKKVGAPGLDKQTTPVEQQFFGGPLIGPLKAAHGLIDADLGNPTGGNTTQRIRGANEIMEGLMQTPGPAGLLIPGALPAVAGYGVAGAAVGKVAKMAGANDDESELAQNLSMGVAPLVHTMLPSVGRTVSRYSPEAGKAASYAAAAYELGKTHNPASLLIGLPHVGKVAAGAVDMAGRGMSAVGDLPRPLIDNSEFNGATPSDGEAIPSTAQSTDKFARNIMGMRSGYPKNQYTPTINALESGALITPPPAPPETGMEVPRAQAQVVRGKGGRMTRQYTAQSDTGKTQMSPEPAWQPPELGPKAPPNAGKPLIDTPPEASVDQRLNPDRRVGHQVFDGIDRRVGDRRELQAKVDEFSQDLKPAEDEVAAHGNDAMVSNTPEYEESVRKATNIRDKKTSAENALSKLNEPEPEDSAVNVGPDDPSYKSVPLTNDSQSPIINSDMTDVKSGDFSLNQPQTMYHGSENPNLINTGLEGRIPVSARSDDRYGSNPEDYRGVYLSQHPQLASESGSNLYKVDLPRGSRMRPDPASAGEDASYDGDKVIPGSSTESLIHRGDIPSGAVNTREDLIDTKSMQQDLRQGMDADQEKADELGKKDFYKRNKVDTNRKTGQRYNPDTETLLPWADTPWGSGESYEPSEGAGASHGTGPQNRNFIMFSGDDVPEYSDDEIDSARRIAPGDEDRENQLIQYGDKTQPKPPIGSDEHLYADGVDPYEIPSNNQAANELDMPHGDINKAARGPDSPFVWDKEGNLIGYGDKIFSAKDRAGINSEVGMGDKTDDAETEGIGEESEGSSAVKQNVSDILKNQNDRDVNDIVGKDDEDLGPFDEEARKFTDKYSGKGPALPPEGKQGLVDYLNASEFLKKNGIGRETTIGMNRQGVMNLAKSHGWPGPEVVDQPLINTHQEPNIHNLRNKLKEDQIDTKDIQIDMRRRSENKKGKF